jgi:hypothetical protein
MKSGTTSLHDYLNKHPDIFMSKPKEIHYYSSENKMSKETYLSHFRSDKKIKGTSPQSYTKAHYRDFKHVPERIYRDSPDVKLLYIVRDPFERMISHALENRYGDDLTRVKGNFESGHYWKTSLYHYQISQYLKYFKKSQIHILTLEDLKKNKLNELNKIFQFLGVHELKDEKEFEYIKNDAASKQVPNFIKSQLWFRLLRNINRGIALNLAEKLVNLHYESFLLKPKLNSVIDQHIVEKIRQDAEKLEKEFAIDISTWDLNPSLHD